MSPARNHRPQNYLAQRRTSEVDVLALSMTKVANRDALAFAELYDQIAGMVYGLIKKVLIDPAQAEEVSQEVFIEIWRLAPRYSPSKGTVRNWVATVAHRRAVDRVRSEQSSKVREQSTYEQTAKHHDHELDINLIENKSLIAQALQNLSQPQQEAIVLAYFQGLTYKEIARRLDAPEGTIKTRIRDGMSQLRDQLRDHA